jgi:hypothetical protein
MGTVGTYTPEKLVLGILTSLPDEEAGIVDAVQEVWGPVDYQSSPIPFTWSGYYDQEMGAPIVRLFVSFESLVDPSRLAAIKEESNILEGKWRRAGRRAVNLDPGLLALSRFTLATTKDNAHRIPLTGGIYAEITLLYSRGGFRPLDWTYPDYRSAPYRAILNDIRARYKQQLQAR